MDRTTAAAAVTAALAEARAGRVEQGISALERLVADDPGNADAAHELGLLLAQTGRMGEALGLLEKAAKLAPREMRYQLNLGLLLQRCGDLRGAIGRFERASRVAPGDPYPLRALAVALREAGELEGSAGSLSRLIQLVPGDADAHNLRGLVRLDQGLVSSAVASFRSAAQVAGPNPAAHSNLLLAKNYDPYIEPRELFEAHVEFGRTYGGAPAAMAERRAAADGRLRIGYLSPDLRNHAVAHFLFPVLANHDRGRFAVTCYNDTRAPDAVTAQLRGLPERWREVAGLNDSQLAAAIEADQIDILIELAGHTNDNRLPLLAQRRLAPVQVTYLGYPNTTGLTTIDYRITDAIADPPGMTDGQYTERLVRLAGRAFFTSVRLPEAPGVGPLPAASGRTRGQVTFGVISNFPKVNHLAMRWWADILQAIPSARLLIQAKPMADSFTRSQFVSFFGERGIAPERIECRGWSTFPDFLRLLNEHIDIVLDTWPFAGHTTTCHALLMGVPVITLATDSFRGRMGASILTHIGMPELIADNASGYSERAIELASDLPRLAGLRAELRERLLGSVIYDHAGFTRRLESAYAGMVQERTSGSRG